MIVISSPSGAGKTSVCKKLLELDSELRASISVTTRKPRNNETNGIDYIFISKEDFDKKISQVGNALKANGFVKGDVIALYMPQIIETYIAYFAILKVGCVVLPLFSGYGSNAVIDRLKISEVRVVDDYTIDFVTKAPNPLFPDSIANFMILDKGWSETNGANHDRTSAASLEARPYENMTSSAVNAAPS